MFKSNITESVLSFAAFKQSKELKKNDGAKRSRLTVRATSPVPVSTDFVQAERRDHTDRR